MELIGGIGLRREGFAEKADVIGVGLVECGA